MVAQTKLQLSGDPMMEVARLTLETALRSTGRVGVQVWIRDDLSTPCESCGQRRCWTTVRKTSPCVHEEIQINDQRRAYHFRGASLRALLVDTPAVVIFGLVEVALFLFGEVATVLGLVRTSRCAMLSPAFRVLPACVDLTIGHTLLMRFADCPGVG